METATRPTIVGSPFSFPEFGAGMLTPVYPARDQPPTNRGGTAPANVDCSRRKDRHFPRRISSMKSTLVTVPLIASLASR
jgi:hypothetical protein